MINQLEQNTRYDLQLNTDQILLAMGADPTVIGNRKPAILGAAHEALIIGLPLIKPAVSQSLHTVDHVAHHSLVLRNGKRIISSLVSQELKNSHSVAAVVCSIGSGIELASRQRAGQDPMISMALDALGSAAVEQLSMEVCRQYEKEAAARSEYASQPISPGLEGWSVQEGQPIIFDLLDAATAGVELISSMVMVPVKSASFMIGFSNTPFQTGQPCDYCNMRENCRYRGNHIHAI